MLKVEVRVSVFKSNGDNVVFNSVNRVETEESYEDLTDTAVVTIPNKITNNGLNLFTGSNPIFKRGDRIKIEAGYDNFLRTIFEGYISKVSARLPVVLECEDMMFLLKQYTVSYPSKKWEIERDAKGRFTKRPKITSEKITLKQLLDHIIEDDIDYVLVDKDINLGQFRVTNATPAMVLDKLKSEYGLYSYFRDGKLHIGFANDASSTYEATYRMEQVVINANDLEYQLYDALKYKVRAVSMDDNNVKTEITYGDEDGQQTDLHFYNLSEADLKKEAEKWLEKNKYTGFVGNLETFGEPYLMHGDRAKIISTKLPERNGTYLIKGVKRTVGMDGYRQIFKLGIKVS